jgi:hypothetical protein
MHLAWYGQWGRRRGPEGAGAMLAVGAAQGVARALAAAILKGLCALLQEKNRPHSRRLGDRTTTTTAATARKPLEAQKQSRTEKPSMEVRMSILCLLSVLYIGPLSPLSACYRKYMCPPPTSSGLPQTQFIHGALNLEPSRWVWI